MRRLERIKAFVNVKHENGKFSIEKVSPLFEKLMKNVTNEYKKFHANREPHIENIEIPSATKSESPINTNYLLEKNFMDTFISLKEKQELPFSITQEIKSKTPSEDSSVVFPFQNNLRTTYFVNHSFSRETFLQIQRQHKIWWMKYGATPGKYSISDQKSESFSKYVNIISSNDDFSMNVERLRMFSIKDCIKEKESVNKFLARASNRKKETVPDIIEAVIDLQVASFAFLVDGVSLSEEFTNLHRRSAPYQLALIANGNSKDVLELTKYIELLTQASDSNIQILNESQSTKCNQEEQFKMYDSIGVPYAIIVSEDSLNSGFLQLRNRNTNLSETIHLSDVSNYLINIFNSA